MERLLFPNLQNALCIIAAQVKQMETVGLKAVQVTHSCSYVPEVIFEVAVRKWKVKDYRMDQTAAVKEKRFPKCNTSVTLHLQFEPFDASYYALGC